MKFIEKDFQIEILKALRSYASPITDFLMQVVTFFGEQYILILALAILYFFYDKKVGQRVAYAIFVSLGVNNTIKGLVKCERPFVYDSTLDSVRKETATGYSFPSGHTQNASVLYTSIALVFKKKWITITAVIAILLIGFSRNYLAVHYVTDVVVGAILGVLLAFGCSYLHKKVEDNFNKQMLLYLISFIVLLPFVFIFWKSDYEEIKIYKDFYTGYSLFAGFIIAVYIENKYVNFDCSNSLKIKIIRLIIAGVIAAILQFGLKIVFPSHILFDMLRYFLLSFVTLGIYPIVSKKWLFYKQK